MKPPVNAQDKSIARLRAKVDALNKRVAELEGEIKEAKTALLKIVGVVAAIGGGAGVGGAEVLKLFF